MREKYRAHGMTMACIFAMGCLCMLFVGAVHAQWPVIHDTNILIRKQISSRQWWLVDDQHPNGFMYYGCVWPGNEDYIKAGYYVREAWWRVERVEGESCNSIREQGLEFDYAWKPDGTAKTIQEAGYE